MKGKRLIEELTKTVQQKSDLPINFDCEKNHPLYFISSPVFRELQRANPKEGGGSDYRTGISVSCYSRGLEIGISTIFSPGLLHNFLENTQQNEIERLFKRILRLTPGGWITWDSSQLYKNVKHLKKSKRTSSDFIFFADLDPKFKDFIDELKESEIAKESWLSDVGCKPESSGKGKFLVSRGNRFSFGFYFNYDEKVEIVKTAEILATWLPKFLPQKFKKGRDANLRRSLINKSVPKICAQKGCQVKNLKLLDAGHIKPHSSGGSDHFTNGIWICKEHHSSQEGQSSSWHHVNLKKKSIQHTNLV